MICNFRQALLELHNRRTMSVEQLAVTVQKKNAYKSSPKKKKHFKHIDVNVNKILTWMIKKYGVTELNLTCSV